MKLALGTVQFGLTYGVANTGGQVTLTEAKKILDLARNFGIEMLDTAAEYGESESALGKIGVCSFKVVTKLPSQIDDGKHVATWVKQCLKTSLRFLGAESIYGLLLHRSEQLTGPSGKQLFNAVNELKVAGLIKKFGVSIYDPSELDAVTQICMPDIVQAPLNVLDRRLIASGWLQKLHDSGVEVHIRSVFLQGLLLLPRQNIPEKFKLWTSLFDSWHTWQVEHSADPLVVSLAAVSGYLINRVIVGVDSPNQLQQIVQAAEKCNTESYPDLSCDDLNLIKPSNWNTL